MSSSGFVVPTFVTTTPPSSDSVGDGGRSLRLRSPPHQSRQHRIIQPDANPPTFHFTPHHLRIRQPLRPILHALLRQKLIYPSAPMRGRLVVDNPEIITPRGQRRLSCMKHAVQSRTVAPVSPRGQGI